MLLDRVVPGAAARKAMSRLSSARGARVSSSRGVAEALAERGSAPADHDVSAIVVVPVLAPPLEMVVLGRRAPPREHPRSVKLLNRSQRSDGALLRRAVGEPEE